MIDLLTDPPKNLTLSKVLIATELRSRGGWQAYMYHPQSVFWRVVRPDGKSLEIYGSTPPTVSFVDGTRSDNKFETYLLLKANNIDTPETFLISDLVEAKSCFDTFFSHKKDGSLVVKPLDSSHGNGVTVDVTTIDGLMRAYDSARQYSEKILMQEQVRNSVDLRLTVINYRCVEAVVRVPASVVGDGRSTIEKLIELENKQSYRGTNYSKPKNRIDSNKAKMYLGDAFYSTPKLDKKVQVIGTANLGTGGDIIDVLADMPPELLQLAEKVATVTHLPVCGVDVLVHDCDNFKDIMVLNPQVIELNKSPSLFLSNSVSANAERVVAKAFVDYLETL